MSRTAETTPVWGYHSSGKAEVFNLKGDELLPQGWFESPSQAAAEGKSEAVERELRFALERRAEAVGLKIEAPWNNERLEAEVHRAEVMKAAQAGVQPKRAEAPDDEEGKSKARLDAEARVRTPPTGESGAELGQRAIRIDQQQKRAARLLKEDEARKRAASDEDAKPTADDIAKSIAK